MILQHENEGSFKMLHETIDASWIDVGGLLAGCEELLADMT